MNQNKTLREVRVVLQELKSNEKLQLREPPNTEGKNTKLGGEPTWIQEPEVVSCPYCNRQMTFVGQIDSFDFIDKYIPGVTKYGSEEYMFGDVGLIYIFFCFECSEAKAICQSY